MSVVKRSTISIHLAVILIVVIVPTFSVFGCIGTSKGSVTVYSAPPGEELSQDYRVSVAGQEIPVYVAKVSPADTDQRWSAMNDIENSHTYFDTAAFAYFDMHNPVTVTVTVPNKVSTAKILPTSAGIAPVIEGNSISFDIESPMNLTVEINDEWVRSLHIFANPPETNVPSPDDPNVIYFGPGVHEVSRLVVGDNKSVYVAGGAIVRAVIGPDEKFEISNLGMRNYAPTFELKGSNITFRGRGTIDASACTTHARNMISVHGNDITLEGVILRDSSVWTVPIRQSDNVMVRNIKLLGYRANSDGIDICNSRNVTVENCFIRTLDDLVVVKSEKDQGAVNLILVKGCVLWNQVAHALSIGAEIRDDVDDVLFTDCDIIHDQGREWSLRIYHCDAARVSNVRFENIRIEEARKCLSLWINQMFWSRDQERGHIQGVVFKDIRAYGDPLTVELVGFDSGHMIEDVLFENVILNGEFLTQDGIQTNEYVKNVAIYP